MGDDQTVRAKRLAREILEANEDRSPAEVIVALCLALGIIATRKPGFVTGDMASFMPMVEDAILLAMAEELVATGRMSEADMRRWIA